MSKPRALAVLKQLIALVEAGRVKPDVLASLLEGKRIELTFARQGKGFYDDEMLLTTAGIRQTLNPPDLLGAAVFAAPKPEPKKPVVPVKPPPTTPPKTEPPKPPAK